MTAIVEYNTNNMPKFQPSYGSLETNEDISVQSPCWNNGKILKLKTLITLQDILQIAWRDISRMSL